MKPTTLTPAAIESQRQQLIADHAAQLAVLNAQKAAVVAIRAPAVELLTQRSELLQHIANANYSREQLLANAAKWCAAQNHIWAGIEGVTAFRHHWNQYQNEAIAAAGLAECEDYIARNRAKLAAIEAELTAYTSKHGLNDMLPADFATN
jgi:hypothetical protein